MPLFTAPDGSQFDSLRSYRQHIFTTHFKFENRAEEDLFKFPGEVDGQEFQLANLSGCTVRVLDVCDRYVVNGLSNCAVFLGPSVETVDIRNCTGCTFTVVGKEVRVTDSADCTLRVFTPGPVLLSNSHGIVLGRFNGAYSGLTAHFERAGLTPSTGPVEATDFSSRDAELPTPHFTFMSAEDEAAETWAEEIPNAAGPPENPLQPDGETADPPAPANPPPDLNPPDEEAHSDADLSAGQAAQAEDEPFAVGEEADAEADRDPFAAQEDDVAAFSAEEEPPVAPPAMEAAPDADPYNSADSQQHPAAADDFEFFDNGGDDNHLEHDAEEVEDPFGSPDGPDGDQQDPFASSEHDPFAESSEPAMEHADLGQPEPQSHGDYFGDAGDSAAHDSGAMVDQQFQQDPLQHDSFGSVPAAAADPADDDGAALAAFESQFQSRVQSKDSEDASKRSAMQEKAEEELDEHYEERSNRNAVRYSSNREAQKALLEAQEPNVDDDATWERVLSLIDTKQAADKADEGPDMARMRGLLIQLKNTPAHASN